MLALASGGLCLASGGLWAGLVVWIIFRAARQAGAYLPSGQAGAPDSAQLRLPGVAVVLPARDEAANLGPCLDALMAQRGLAGGWSVLVVDDNSCDGTAALVRAHAARNPRIRLQHAGELPPGWMGKPHACWKGALAADAEYLCFIDADVRAAPDLLATALRVARDEGIGLLSLMPFQELGSFWERLVLPAGMLLIACAQDLRVLNADDSPQATANGQFLLIRRDLYFAVGGHAAVRGEVCEDKALALLVRRAGHRVRLLAGERLARVRMYTGLRSLWHGFGKNAVDILGNPRTTLAVALAGLVAGWLVPLLPLAVGIAALRDPSRMNEAGFALALAASLAALGLQSGALRHFRVPMAMAALFPLALLLTALLAAYSVTLRRRGQVRWKGRSYAVRGGGAPGGTP
jgi:chlorobactene glucosyltransferase